MSDKYKEYLEEKVKSKIADDLTTLQSASGTCQRERTRTEITLIHNKPVIPRKPLYQIDAADVVTYIFAAICLVLPFIMEEYQIAWLFGLALLISLLTRSLLARVATLAFTAIYFVLFIIAGVFFDLTSVFNIIFGINTIGLVPVVVGTLMSILAMGGGAVHGLSGSTKYAGLWICALALLVSIADTLIAVYILAVSDWYIIFSAHLAIYLVALLLAWGIAYLTGKLIRYGVITALR